MAYVIVWKAADRRNGEVVAVKKIFNAFRNQKDAQRTFREIVFLQHFGDHPNIIKLHNVIRADYLVFEFMVYLGIYQPEFLRKYSRISTILEMNIILAQQNLREVHNFYHMYNVFAFSKEEMSIAKEYIHQLLNIQTDVETVWKRMLWITEITSRARSRQHAVGIPITFELTQHITVLLNL